LPQERERGTLSRVPKFVLIMAVLTVLFIALAVFKERLFK